MSISPGETVWGARIEEHEDDDWFQYKVVAPVGNEGGAGAVYTLSPNTEPPLVGKFYNEDLRASMTTNREAALRIILPALHRDGLNQALDFASWPRRILFDVMDPPAAELHKHIIGFTMELLIGTKSLNTLLGKDSDRRNLTRERTIHIAITLADQLAKMHRHTWGFVFGDMSPMNIHVTKDFAKVLFIDTDSFQFDNGAFECKLTGLTPEYSSPGARAAIAANRRVTATHDDFVLAVLIYQLLMRDLGFECHPFSMDGDDADDIIDRRFFPMDAGETNGFMANAYKELPEDIRAAFTQTFTKDNPVTALQWIPLLTNYRRSLWRS
ncbi:hypothetical protein [Hyphomicrobium sp. DY-1]|uniref:hypothetical protein n=1 Tax=Hyphomicrobium sp. DY-1 TaxID=3075650 RepID=UPI0039C23A30